LYLIIFLLNQNHLIILAAGYKLIRSYKTEADEKDKLNDITHLVFLVHGIGHKIDNKKIIRNTSQ
jgi:hypothetical protein